MEAVILAWDPDRPVWAGSHAAAVRTVQARGLLRQLWGFPSALRPAPELEVWLVIIGARSAMCGLSGHGTVGWVGSGAADATTIQVAVDVDLLLPLGDQVALTRLEEELPELRLEEGVQPVDRATARTLRRLWTGAAQPERGALDPIPGSLPSRAVRRVLINRYEQDPELRRTVLAYRGSACHACGLDMEQRYGTVARDLVQVHHVTPPGFVDTDYEIDPLSDLVPLCGSCHVVAHNRWPDPYSVEEIRLLLRENGFLRGSTLTDAQLLARADAARLLGPPEGDQRTGR
ncbi:hypothetical protein FQ377_09910 [Arthrobacter echini]|uniref:HNH endonuclease n=1 Tax=Arthrobacter echini TaxID=1529066 RepID=A0A5D0XS40_9MICC|nr:hypothetical protein [Arthrobacter echini]TYC98621.1 hypothetical protein FQ377_09910 [Arthrobacter echini]